MDLPFALGLAWTLGLAAACGFTAAMAGRAADFAAAAFGRGVAAGRAERADPALAAARTVVPDLAAAVPDLAVPDLAVPGLAVPDLAVLDLAAAVFGRAAVRDFAAVFGRAAVRDFAAVFGLAAVFGAVAAGLAADMVLAADVSDLAAVVMAFVALFIACMAADIVLAEDVAFVAAAVIFVAAEVTLVAADETVLTAAAVVGAAAVLRVVLTAVARAPRATRATWAPAFVFGRRAARLDVLPLVDLVRLALTGLRRAAVRIVVRAGTDLPPVLINYASPIPRAAPIYTPVAVLPAEQWSQADRNPPLIPRA